MYIYPDNLKAAPTFWLWRLKDITIGGLLAVLGAITFVYADSFLVAAIAAVYLFLTIRFDDVCILDFIRKAFIFFIARPQFYRWRNPYERLEVDHHRRNKVKRKKTASQKQVNPRPNERQGNNRKQHYHSERR